MDYYIKTVIVGCSHSSGQVYIFEFRVISRDILLRVVKSYYNSLVKNPTVFNSNLENLHLLYHEYYITQYNNNI